MVVFFHQEETMALPIKETPVLKGRDAVRFIERMVVAESEPVSKKEKKEYKQAKELYDKIRQKNKSGF
jgi:hypothetical protein